MGHTEEFLNRKWVKVCYFQCSQDCVFCHLLAGGWFTQHSCATGITARIWSKRLNCDILARNLFWQVTILRRGRKKNKVGKKSCKGCTSCRCSLLLPGPCRPSCAVQAPAPSALPKQPPCLSLRHSWTPTVFLNSAPLPLHPPWDLVSFQLLALLCAVLRSAVACSSPSPAAVFPVPFIS